MSETGELPCCWCNTEPAPADGSCCPPAGVIEDLSGQLGKLRDLLDRAWDKIPEGYTVLRGEILTALGRPGCIYCGFACSESNAGPCDRPLP